MERVVDRIEGSDPDGARVEVDRMAARFGACPEVSYVRGLLRLEEDDEDAALDLLLEAFRADRTLVDAGLTALDLLDEEDASELVLEVCEALMDMDLTAEERADVLYRTALCHTGAGDEERARDLFLEVWHLDRRRGRRSGAFHVSRDRFFGMVRRAVQQLPDPIRLRIEHLPIVVQDRPDREAVQDGFDPRALGMFDGAPYAEQGAPVLTRIVVFQSNVEDVVVEERALEEEVYVTLLHETGHFFGLSEEDLDRRGLA
jgi:predicted Zn-dependent protease with MMP-like domain